MAKLTIEEMRKQKNRNKTKKTKKQKKQTESNSKPKSRRGAKENQDKPKKNEELLISKHPKSRPGLYYGNDGIKWDPVRKIWYDATVHKTKT